MSPSLGTDAHFGDRHPLARRTSVPVLEPSAAARPAQAMTGAVKAAPAVRVRRCLTGAGAAS
ncbi:hypothetical protein [Streptomyces sp. NPDC090021]|uniref:hypothetical protein n=1 Tax=Streptomyces sp. NPDC090021 TaxID=3365919 RepID=UPI00382D2D55